MEENTKNIRSYLNCSCSRVKKKDFTRPLRKKETFYSAAGKERNMTYLNFGGQVLASAVTGGLNLGFRRGVILFQFRSSFQKEKIGENFLPFFFTFPSVDVLC